MNRRFRWRARARLGFRMLRASPTLLFIAAVTIVMLFHAFVWALKDAWEDRNLS